MLIKNHFTLWAIAALLFAMLVTAMPIRADEGMWTFDNPPVKQLEKKYNFTPTKEWLDLVRLSSVHFGGGSGSLISPDGLVMTNHHVAMNQLQKMSTAEKNYVATGFYAATLAEEAKCPDLELRILMGMEEVTNRIMGAIKPGMKEEEALKAREAEIAKIEKELEEKTGFKIEVISLYHGGEYWAYEYKQYTDVRLVMAPERQIAYFGGDDDNFTYPRYDLDMAFFRIYENDKPINNTHYLKFNTKGAADGELMFVSGHPGSTNRLDTYEQRIFQRDFKYPMTLKMIEKRLQVLYDYSKRGPEQTRRALALIFGLENSKKAQTGEYKGLLDANLMAKAKQEEDALRKMIKQNPQWQKKYGDAWGTIAKVIVRQKKNYVTQYYRDSALNSRFISMARQIVFYIAEIKKPDADRLDGYHDTQLKRFKFRLLSPAPIYKDLEETLFAAILQNAEGQLDIKDVYLQKILNGRTAAQTAKEMIEATQLDRVTARKALLDGGIEAVAQSKDPFIVLARDLEPEFRKNIKETKKNTESPLTSAGEKIAQARFALYGKSTSPDANSTLRLSYGQVKGYPMNGTKAPYKTTLYGLFGHSLGFDQQGAFALPQRFWDRKDAMDMSTPVNFVTTNDIIGGNSGSPVINQNAELVGLVFDGNIESLVGRFVYDDTVNRCVAVHSAFIIEGLRKLYDAGKLADEIEGK